MRENYRIKPDQAKVIKDLEKLIDKPIPQVKKFTWDEFGFKIEGEEIIELGLFNKELTSLPESIGNLTSLKKLNLMINPIISLPESLKKLNSLRIFQMAGNNLTTLPEIICDLSSLRELELGNNMLRNIPESIGNLRSLKKLELHNNNLTTLPKTISNLKFLKILDLGQNHLSALPESIFYLESLEKLKLERNKLINLPKSLGNLKSLKLLDLGYNNLTTLPESISNLKLLEELVLIENDLNMLPQSFGHLKNLKTIDLRGNKWKGEWKELEKNDISIVLELCRKLHGIKIFISHAWVDQEKYRILVLEKYLENSNIIHEVYVCEEDLVGGIWEFMAENVPKSHLLIFIATYNSISSDACRYELSLAKKYGIRILPIKGIGINWEELNRIDLIDYNQNFLDLSKLEKFEFDGDNFQDIFEKLLHYIKNYEHTLKLHKREREELEIEKSNIKNNIISCIDSKEFREKLKENFVDFEKNFQDVSNNKITNLEYFMKWGQILYKKGEKS